MAPIGQPPVVTVVLEVVVVVAPEMARLAAQAELLHITMEAPVAMETINPVVQVVQTQELVEVVPKHIVVSVD